MASVMGGGISSMLIMLLVGIPLYICATASTPIAAALILKGVSPGAALVFLLVGPATNVTSLSVLVGILGRWGTVRYLLVLSIFAVAFGLGVDQFYRMLHISPKAVIGEAAELIPERLKYAGAAILLALSIRPLSARFRRKKTRPPRPRISRAVFRPCRRPDRPAARGNPAHPAAAADRVRVGAVRVNTGLSI